MKRAFIVLAIVATGCTPSPSPQSTDWVGAVISVIDADIQVRRDRPQLPDTLGKPTDAASPAASPAVTDPTAVNGAAKAPPVVVPPEATAGSSPVEIVPFTEVEFAKLQELLKLSKVETGTYDRGMADFQRWQESREPPDVPPQTPEVPNDRLPPDIPPLVQSPPPPEPVYDLLYQVVERLDGIDKRIAVLETPIVTLADDSFLTALEALTARVAKLETPPVSAAPAPPKAAAPTSPLIIAYSPHWCSACAEWKRTQPQGLDVEWISSEVPNPPPGLSYPAFKIGGNYWWGLSSWNAVAAKASEADSGASLSPDEQPTPIAEVRRALSILRPGRDERFIDIGCGGDARVLIEAVRLYGCRAVGIEIDSGRARSARKAVADAGLSGMIEIIEGDAADVEWKADVGFVYLFPSELARLAPKLRSLDRFVSYMHEVDGLQMSNHSGVYLWSRPTAARTSQAVQWRGQWYTGPICNSPTCRMCNEIRALKLSATYSAPRISTQPSSAAPDRTGVRSILRARGR